MVSPSTDTEKVLVVGYWFQFRDGAQELEALKINNQLKHFGHGVGNVSRALELHKTLKPALMIQKRKEGATKQARKKFVVTDEGKKYVEKMLAKVSVLDRRAGCGFDSYRALIPCGALCLNFRKRLQRT